MNRAVEQGAVGVQRVIASVIGTAIDVIGWDQALERISSWARSGDSRVVCICNVHSVVTARTDHEFQSVLSSADMATPDGAPVAWLLRRFGHRDQGRINGPDLMWKYCQRAANSGDSIYLYGATTETIQRLQEKLLGAFPSLRIAGAISPPFRVNTTEEDSEIVDAINRSGARVVWVSLGCPKQEKWMMAHRGRINAVMVGVGAAFDYHAGTVKRAPLWMQHNGLEWFYRLMSEPRRLWRRYLVTNVLFIWYVMGQLSRRDGRVGKGVLSEGVLRRFLQSFSRSNQ